MRLGHPRSYCWRLVLALGCVAAGALGCINVPLQAPVSGQTANASLWACVTTAALALLCMKKSR
jgi:hypothetical protein